MQQNQSSIADWLFTSTLKLYGVSAFSSRCPRGAKKRSIYLARASVHVYETFDLGHSMRAYTNMDVCLIVSACRKAALYISQT